MGAEGASPATGAGCRVNLAGKRITSGRHSGESAKGRTEGASRDTRCISQVSGQRAEGARHAFPPFFLLFRYNVLNPFEGALS